MVSGSNPWSAQRYSRLEAAAAESAGVTNQLAASVAQRLDGLFETKGLVDHGTPLAMQVEVADDPLQVSYDTIDWGQTTVLPSGHTVRLLAARAPERGSPIHLVAATTRNHAFPLAAVVSQGVIEGDYVQLGRDGLDPANILSTYQDPQPSVGSEPDRERAIAAIKRMVDIDPRRTSLGNPGLPDSGSMHRLRKKLVWDAYQVQDQTKAVEARMTYGAAAELAELYPDALEPFKRMRENHARGLQTSDGTLRPTTAWHAYKARRALRGDDPGKIQRGEVPGTQNPAIREALLHGWLDQHDVPKTKYDGAYPELLGTTAHETGVTAFVEAVIGNYDPAVEKLIQKTSQLAQSGRPLHKRVLLYDGLEPIEATAIVQAHMDMTAVHADQWVMTPASSVPEPAGRVSLNLYAGNPEEVLPRKDIVELHSLLG